MKMKNLLVVGLVALVLTLGAGTASAQNQPTPGGDDSTNADETVTQMFALAQQALNAAESTGDPATIQLAYDLYVASYLAFVSVDGYNQGYFSVCIIVGFPDDLTGDAEIAAGYLLSVQNLAGSLVATGNPFAAEIGFLAQVATNDLTLALQNGD